jgi:hypothetical protein
MHCEYARIYICKLIEKFQKYYNLIYLIIKHMHRVTKKIIIRVLKFVSIKKGNLIMT